MWYNSRIIHVPVVELDTIKASDAFGSGSSPDGHTKAPIYGGFFVEAGREPTGSPDAEGGARAACGEVSPPGAPKPPFTGAFAYRQG